MPRLKSRTRRVALIGNPNVGKSTIFGRLAGARVRTANFPGTTQDIEMARAPGCELVDLPGVYSLDDGSSEAEICRGALAGRLADRLAGGAGERPATTRPDVVCVVADGANLSRSLRLAGEVIRIGLPVVLVVNRVDQATRRGLSIDHAGLAARIGCEVVVTNGLTGDGVEGILPALGRARPAAPVPSEMNLRDWAEGLASRSVTGRPAARADALTDRLDDVLTHPVLGGLAFAVVMGALFWTVFKIASYPMDWIDGGFAWLGGALHGVLPAGPIRALLVDGIVAGVGATVVFLPQICVMFFLISLLEHSGYLPRAALLVDRFFRPFGLPGQAFVPLLSAHACAIPGIIVCRGIPDRRERLTAILVAPFMSCTARIPVYVLLTSLLFADRPGLAALAFAGCYVLGAAAAIGTAVLLRRTLLKGPARPMAIELPAYRAPSLRQALMSAVDRGLLFLRKAGTVILGMVVALWWLGEYPHVAPPPEAVALREQAAAEPEGAGDLLDEADRLEARHASAGSFMGMAGRAAAPVFEPLGFDWQLTVGVLTSFAAREVFVSTMAVVLETDEESLHTEPGLRRIAEATRSDGRTPVFSGPASWSLLVFYVLAMQCLPTLAVTARESGGWRWAGVQLAWMSLLAYTGGFIAHQAAVWLG